MMAVNFLPNFLGGGFLQGWLGTYWDKMDKSAFLRDDCRDLRRGGSDHLGLDRPLRPFLEEKIVSDQKHDKPDTTSSAPAA